MVNLDPQQLSDAELRRIAESDPVAARAELEERQRRREEKRAHRAEAEEVREWARGLTQKELEGLAVVDDGTQKGPAPFRSPEDVFDATQPPWGPLRGWEHAAQVAREELRRRREPAADGGRPRARQPATVTIAGREVPTWMVGALLVLVVIVAMPGRDEDRADDGRASSRRGRGRGR